MRREPTTDAPASTPLATVCQSDAELAWKDLTETEKSAASLGVKPDDYKPIAFMSSHRRGLNPRRLRAAQRQTAYVCVSTCADDAHYNTLLKTNAIDGELAKKLEAFKSVASAAAKSV